MQTVNFRCGHCNNLMAVSTQYLGQQVRCPHCQQVVVAPTAAAPAPAPAPAPTPAPAPFPDLGATEVMFPVPSQADHEDIFTQTEDADDLFGRSSAPRLELPPEPAPAPAPANGPTPGDMTMPLPAPEPTVASTLAWTPSGEASALAAPPPQEGATAVATAAEPAPWMTTSTVAETDPAPGGGRGSLLAGAATTAPPAEGASDALASIPKAARREAQGGAWFMPLVFIPLCFYAVMATIAIGLLLYTRQQAAQPASNSSPFEQLPDVDGDEPGVRKPGDPAGVRRPRAAGHHFVYEERLVEAPLPANLRVRLAAAGEKPRPLRIGDLEVTPVKVERKTVRIYVEGFPKSEPCKNDSLVLHLHLRNLSSQWAFTPLDNFFDRRWTSPKEGLPPLTLLEVGSRRYYGGPAAWCPRKRRRDDSRRREWIEGPGRVEYDPLGLGPGKEMDTVVCTDGGQAGDPDRDGDLIHVLDGTSARGAKVREPYQGKLLWRVQLRRGLITENGKRYPATTVIGVEFTARDVQPG